MCEHRIFNLVILLWTRSLYRYFCFSRKFTLSSGFFASRKVLLLPSFWHLERFVILPSFWHLERFMILPSFWHLERFVILPSFWHLERFVILPSLTNNIVLKEYYLFTQKKLKNYCRLFSLTGSLFPL